MTKTTFKDAKVATIRICTNQKFVLPKVVVLRMYAATCTSCGSTFEVDEHQIHADHGIDGRAGFSGWTVGDGWHNKPCPCGGGLVVPHRNAKMLKPTRTVYLVKRSSSPEWVVEDKLPTCEYLDVTKTERPSNYALRDEEDE